MGIGAVIELFLGEPTLRIVFAIEEPASAIQAMSAAIARLHYLLTTNVERLAQSATLHICSFVVVTGSVIVGSNPFFSGEGLALAYSTG